MLLAAVMEFNLSAAPERYAEVAVAMGAAPVHARGNRKVRRRNNSSIHGKLRIPRTLAALKVPADAVPAMAAGAMKVTRLLDRNIRPVTYDDAVAIYQKVLA